MPKPRKSVRQLAEMIRDPRRALSDPAFWNEPVCRRWLHHVGVVHLSDPSKAVPLAILGVRLALRVVRRQHRRGLRNRCVLARAYGLLGFVCPPRSARAARAMTRAEEVAGECKDPDVWSDIYWRQAFRCVELAQRPDGSHDPAGVRDALQLAEAAVDKARTAYAVARAKTTRGVVMIRAGDLQKAAEDAREAVEGLDPKRHPHEHTSALSVLVSALARGDGQNREEAVGYLEELRRAIPRRYPASRARLQWAKALLYVPNRRRKARARKLLNDARRTFVRLGMKDEAVAVLAELTRINPAGAVPEICTEVLAILGEGPTRDLVEKLRTVRMVRRVDVAELLRAAIRGPGVLPAAVWPGP